MAKVSWLYIFSLDRRPPVAGCDAASQDFTSIGADPSHASSVCPGDWDADRFFVSVFVLDREYPRFWIRSFEIENHFRNEARTYEPLQKLFLSTLFHGACIVESGGTNCVESPSRKARISVISKRV